MIDILFVFYTSYNRMFSLRFFEIRNKLFLLLEHTFPLVQISSAKALSNVRLHFCDIQDISLSIKEDGFVIPY